MNLLNKPISVGILLTLVSMTSPISAQPADASVRGPIPFTSYDKNADNLISEAEFNAARGARIATRATEGRQMRGIADAPSFSSFDINSDGQLTRSELADGQKAQRAQKENRRGMRKGRGMNSGMGRNMPPFSEFDLNGDGQIVAEEFDTARAKRIGDRAKQGYPMKNLAKAPSFADIDSNGDGKIDPDEFAAHQAQHHQQDRK